MNCRKNKKRCLFASTSLLFLAITLFSLLMILSGCHAPARRAPSPVACLPSPAFLEKGAVRDALKGTMKALADLDIQTMGKKYPVRIAVMARGPDALRMEAIPVIGPPDFMLSVKGDRLRVFLPEKGEFYMGEASRHLARFIPIPIDVRDVVSILMGTLPPLRAGDCLAPMAAGEDSREIHVLSGMGDLRMSLWLKGPEQILLRLKTFVGNGKADYSVEFSDYGLTNRIAMPEKIVITRSGSAGIKQTITVRYTDLEFTNEPDANAFELSVPPGAKLIELERGVD